MEKIKNIFSWDMLIIVFVNLVLADANIYPFIALFLFLNMENEKLSNIYFMSFIIFFIAIKFLYLPILYYLLNKHSKNKLTQNFIYNLKYNKNTRKLVLIICLIPIILICSILAFYTILYNTFSLINIIPIIDMLIYLLIVSLFSSYLVLFAYWDWKDKRNKKKVSYGKD